MARADMPSLAPAPLPNREAFAKDYLTARRPVCTLRAAAAATAAAATAVLCLRHCWGLKLVRAFSPLPIVRDCFPCRPTWPTCATCGRMST